MNSSLRYRIAAAYALLLVGVLAAASGVIVWRFQAILVDQARARINSTMSEIVAASQTANPFGFDQNADEGLQALLSSSNLASWQSATTFVQIDAINGYPLARTSNLGGSSIPSNTTLRPDADATFRYIKIGSRPFLVEDRLLGNATFAVVAHVAEPLDALNRAFAQTWQTIAFIIVIGALCVVALSFLLAEQAVGPIAVLSHRMKEIGSDRLDRSLPDPRRNDEIGELTRSFNDLLARLHEAFARERQFISDASHELKTPLTSINSNAQLLLRWGDEDAAVRRESLETIERESATLAAMVSGMLTLAKADRGDLIPKEPTSLAQCAHDAVRSAQQRAADKGLELRFNRNGSTPTVEANEALLRQAIGNLIDNAIKFTSSGSIDVTVGSDANEAWVEVADSGPGIPPDALTAIFDRFYRADKARSRDIAGTGLGLAIVRSIVRVHAGSVSARNGQNGGAIFHVAIPLLNASFIEPS